MASPSLSACPACAAPAPRLILDLDGQAPPALPCCAGCGAPRVTVGWRSEPAAFVLLAPARAVSAWPSLERVAERAYWRALGAAPTTIQRDPDRCLRRVVFGAIAAQEKLTIWRAGLDDALIECFKLDLRLRLPRLRATPGADLRLVRVEDALHFATTHGAGIRAPRTRLAQLEAARSTLAHRWPALFTGPFVDHLRLRG